MDILIEIVLPLSLVVIMFSLGVGLRFADFARIARRKRAVALGVAAQVVALPVVAYAVIRIFGLEGEIAVGVMLLAFCPGGVTSNMLARLAFGDVALSVTLTALVSLLSLLTVPVLAAWAVAHFLGETAPDVSIAGLTLAVFLITTLPVLLGVALRHLAPAFADRAEPRLARIAAVLFAAIILAALGANWSLFVENLPRLGPALVVMNVGLLAMGYAIAAGLTARERRTIAIEAGLQNGTLGIALAGLIAPVADGFSALALPSGVYGITMYLVALPFLIWARRIRG